MEKQSDLYGIETVIYNQMHI